MEVVPVDLSRGGEAETLLLLAAIDLKHHAVDFIRKFFALGLECAAERDGLLDIRADAALRVHFEAVVAKPFQRFPMARKQRPAGFVEQKIRVVIEAA